jgi:hypothetical protein
MFGIRCFDRHLDVPFPIHSVSSVSPSAKGTGACGFRTSVSFQSVSHRPSRRPTQNRRNRHYPRSPNRLPNRCRPSRRMPWSRRSGKSPRRRLLRGWQGRQRDQHQQIPPRQERRPRPWRIVGGILPWRSRELCDLHSPCHPPHPSGPLMPPSVLSNVPRTSATSNQHLSGSATSSASRTHLSIGTDNPRGNRPRSPFVVRPWPTPGSDFGRMGCHPASCHTREPGERRRLYENGCQRAIKA